MIRKLLLIVAAGLCCTSCLDLSVKMKVTEKGGGEYAFSLQILDQMYQLIATQGRQVGLDLGMLNRDALEGIVAENQGRLTAYTNEVRDGVRVIEIDASFRDAKKLLDEIGGGMMVMEPAEDGAWLLRFGDTSFGESMGGMTPELMEQQLASFMPIMAGLKMRLDIEVPELIETNLPRTGSGAVRYELDFDRDIAGKDPKEAMAAFRTLLEPKTVRFKGVD